MHYLNFELSDNADGITTLDALAGTSAAQHPAVMAEVQQVLDWAWREFGQRHGPVEEGHDWDHELQIHITGQASDGQVSPSAWHEVTLTLAGSPAFVEAFLARFGEPEQD